MNELDNSTVDAVLGLQNLTPQQRALQRQRQIVQMLREGALGNMQRGPQMAGRVVLAPNLLGAVGNVMQYRAGQRMEDDANVREQNMATQRGAVLKRYFQAMHGRGSAPAGHLGDEGE